MNFYKRDSQKQMNLYKSWTKLSRDSTWTRFKLLIKMKTKTCIFLKVKIIRNKSKRKSSNPSLLKSKDKKLAKLGHMILRNTINLSFIQKLLAKKRKSSKAGEQLLMEDMIINSSMSRNLINLKKRKTTLYWIQEHQDLQIKKRN